MNRLLVRSMGLTAGASLIAWIAVKACQRLSSVDPVLATFADPVDVASEDSFPASDPPSTSGAHS